MQILKDLGKSTDIAFIGYSKCLGNATVQNDQFDLMARKQDTQFYTRTSSANRYNKSIVAKTNNKRA